MPPAVIEQVQKRVGAVNAAFNKALFELDKRSSTEAEAAASAVRSLRKQSAGWAERGIGYAESGDDPPGRGWEGWIAAGQSYLDGIQEVYDLGARGRLENIRATVASVARDVAAAPRTVVTGAADIVGDSADKLISPIFGKVLVLAAIAGAGAYVYFRFLR